MKVEFFYCICPAIIKISVWCDCHVSSFPPFFISRCSDMQFCCRYFIEHCTDKLTVKVFYLMAHMKTNILDNKKIYRVYVKITA